MATAVILIGWGQGVPGREQKALQVFGEGVQYWTRLQQQGEIDSFEPVLLEPHGGDLAGFVLIKGDREKLSRLRYSEEFTRLNTRAGLVVNNLGVVMGWIGQDLQQQFASFGQEAASLT